MSREELRGSLGRGVDPRAFGALVGRWQADGRVVADAATVRAADFTVQLNPKQQALVDRTQAIATRTRRDETAAQLRNAIEQIQEIGCVVKDLDIGLIDFPTVFRGREVYLCWKLGEGAIEYWHGVDEGFRGRKAIDRDFLDHHRGDPAQ